MITKKPESDLVTIALASHPPRKEGMLKVVNDLLPQCDRMCLYLNHYDDAILNELPKSDKLEIILAGEGREHADMKCHGRLYWAAKSEGYYFTVDDDMNYPPDYIKHMIAGIDKYKRKAIVGLGGWSSNPAKKYAHIRGVVNFAAVGADMQHTRLSGPTMGWYATNIKIPHYFGYSYDQFLDDVQIAIWANERNIPMVVLARRHKFITPMDDLYYADHSIRNDAVTADRGKSLITSHDKWIRPQIEHIYGKPLAKQITVALASHPPRKAGMLKVVNDLLPQCDRLCLYLNNYPDSILAELPKSEKLTIILAGPGQPYPDLQCYGKGHWADKTEGYYITVDDDINYPVDFVATMCSAIDLTLRKCIVTVSGGVHDACPIVPREKRYVGYFTACDDFKQVLTFGGGATGWYATDTKMPALFDGNVTDGIDDVKIAIWANKNNVPIITIKRDKNFLTPIKSLYNAPHAIRYNNQTIGSANKIIEEYKDWHIPELPDNIKDIVVPLERELVAIGMASHPPRKEGMLKVVNKLLPQCDKFYLYLNNYDDSILSELPVSDKLEVILAGEGREQPDLMTRGKHYGAQFWDGYYITADDDINYPDNYVSAFIRAARKYKNPVILAFSGAISRRWIYVYDKLSQDALATTFSSVACMYHPKEIGFNFNDIFQDDIKYGDDNFLAIWANKNNIATVVLEKPENFITYDETLRYKNAFSVNKEKTDYVTKLVTEFPWKRIEVPELARTAPVKRRPDVRGTVVNSSRFPYNNLGPRTRSTDSNPQKIYAKSAFPRIV